MSAPIKFDMPDDCRLFTSFPRLPPEIRHRIWEAYLCNPGINFVKLQARDATWRWGMPPVRPVASGGADASGGNGDGDQDPGDDIDDVDLVVKNETKPRRTWHACLVPASPTCKADASHYEELYRQMATLSRTCTESAGLVRSLTARPGVLRLSNGRVVTLDKSPDLVQLEYFPHDFNQTDCNLDVCISCPGLEHVRRVAVRFSHNWRPKHTLNLCVSCGKPHSHLDSGNYPAHLYQFLARHLPNLQEFYFVDYFIVAKTEEEQGDAMCLDGRENPRLFRARDRRFHEVGDCGASDLNWKVDAKIRLIRDWLRDRFVRYAKASKMSQHKSPERVRFGILACEWNISAPKTRQGPLSRLPGKLRTKPTSKMAPPPPPLSSGLRPLAPVTPSLHGSDLHFPGRRGSSSPVVPTGADADLDTAEADGLSTYEFGVSHRHTFKFTFTKMCGSTGRWQGL